MTNPPFSVAAAAVPPWPRSELRRRIDAAWRTPEPQCVPPLVAAARIAPALRAPIEALARRLVSGLRATRARAGGVDALMKEFSLSSQEGVALMCLAEALLRVPDRATADRLIRDKLVRGDWRAHLGHSPSLFVNAATWGLLLTGRLVATRSEEGLANALGRILARGGEPLVRRGMDMAMRMLGEQFVTGRDITEALSRARGPSERGYRYSFDMLGEAAMAAADAARYHAAYVQAIHAIGQDSAGRGAIDANGISVKLSALHPRYTWSQRERVMDELLPRLKALCLLAQGYDIGLSIDAEEADRLELSLDILEALALDPDLAGWDGLGFVVQAYQKRAPMVLDWIVDLARRSGRRLMLRLVKGAYWDAEIKRAQLDGLEGYPVFTRKAYTDVCYLACAKKLLAARDAIYPQFATHNAHTLAAVYYLAGGAEGGDDYELQCLHGMGEPLYDQVLADPALRRRVRIYAPVGSHETLLPYLVRRLLENGANTSFVNRLVDETVPVEDLVRDPVEEAEALAGSPHPRIPLPCELFLPERANSRGLDLASEAVRVRLAEALQASRAQRHSAAPSIVRAVPPSAAFGPVCNPADAGEIVGEALEAEPAAIEDALAAAEAAAGEWAALAPAERAGRIARAADLIEADAFELVALVVREAGKSWAGAVAEVREAVDFCRYYAAQARHFEPALHEPLGPVASISPWNFPLAIFTGQLAAALVAGNPVLAKPAEQTPLVAARAVRLFHRAGVPPAVLQLLPGAGETVGAALVADARVRGVLFTGSTEVARAIALALARRGGDLPLVAETGGQNAMIVDSTALPEQVVADVLASSFDSAGQRCSALRVLCLQEEIAGKVLELLDGALRELAVGDPALVSTDVGPVIDAGARAGLEHHIETMQAAGARVRRLALSPVTARGSFVAPAVIEIEHMSLLEREVFGPVLHVVRYRASELARLIDDVDATGYGLTLGIHSRIDETIEAIVARARVGNIYVNRNMIGAVVGVQPFGGERRSGTGPKAGGPLYLHRLLRRTPGPCLGAGANRPGCPAFEALLGWIVEGAQPLCDEDGRKALIAHGHAYREAALAGLVLPLPGPTGEKNTLSFVPRGPVAAIAETLAGGLHQLLAALASGDHVVLADTPALRALADALPAPVRAAITLSDDPLAGDVAALLLEGEDEAADAWRLRLAHREGAIVPLLRPSPRYDCARLVYERTLSINTAAAGGNASLMSLDDV